MGHSSRPLRGNFCLASKLSAALWSKTAARCFAFSSGHTSTVDSVPFGSIRTTCHPKALASYRSRFILRICARAARRSEVGHNQLRRPLLLRVERRLLGVRPFYQFLDPIKHSLIGDSGRHALVMRDLAVEFDALLTHCLVPHLRADPAIMAVSCETIKL
jgi:hypothetical protein